MKISIVNPLNTDGWNDYLLTLKNPSFFLSRNWTEALCKTYKYKPLYLFVIDDSKVLGMVPILEIDSWLTGKRGVSLPFTDICEPVFTNGLNRKLIMERILQFGSKSGWRYFEVRGGQEIWKDAPPSTHYYEHILNLNSDLERLQSGFRDSTRRNIRKAVRKGVRCQVSNSLKSVKEFYRLNCITRKSHGLPPQPFNFFKNIFDCVISRGMGTVVLARYKERSIAGAMYLHFSNAAIYKYGASEKVFQHLRANNLVMWEAIKWYSERKYLRLHLGRTDPSNSGLLQFKRGWGGEERTIRYYRYNFSRKKFVKTDGVNQLITYACKMLPIRGLILVGSLLYKHIG